MKTMNKKKVRLVIGTRPEAIKMAPLYLELKSRPPIDVKLIVTGQHRELLDQALADFNIKPDHDLRVMRPGQSLSSLTANILKGLETFFRNDRPDLVLLHGDTTTAFATALSCFYQGILSAHVEAGLRSHDLGSPFPEEMYRKGIGKLANFHFAPTTLEKENLLNEGISEKNVIVSGNTVFDSLKAMTEKYSTPLQIKDQKRILLTVHRRDHGEKSLQELLSSILSAADRIPNAHLVCPVHLNPRVKESVYAVLGNSKNVTLLPPLSYSSFIQEMLQASLILTDSGGVQEEAAHL